MLYLLKTAKLKGVKSSIKGQVPIPVSISMTLDGIGGLKVGDIFKIDYLPKPYREFTYFVIKKVDQKISTSGWSTDIEAYMQFNGESYFDANPDRELNIDEASIKKLFEFTDLSIEDISKNLSPLGQEKIDNLIKSFDTGITELESMKNDLRITTLDNIVIKLDSIKSIKIELEESLIPETTRKEINEK